MTKAMFNEKQPEVRMVSLGGNLKQFQIALHEKEVVTTSDMMSDVSSDPQIQYQYDWNEFRTDALTEDDVRADPEKYLDYVPIESLPETEKTASIDARLKSLQEAQEETAQALQDMIAMQMEA